MAPAYPWAQPSQWVMLSDVSPQAKALYVLLVMHVMLSPNKKNRLAWPTQKRLAKLLKVKKTDSVATYTTELEKIGAVTVRRGRKPGRPLVKQNFYTVKLGADAPPKGYVGNVSVWDDRFDMEGEPAGQPGTPSEWGSVGVETSEPHCEGVREPHPDGVSEPHCDGVDLEVLDLEVFDLEETQDLSLRVGAPVTDPSPTGWQDRERDRASPPKSNNPTSHIHGLFAQHGVTEDEADRLRPEITRLHPPGGDGLIINAAKNGTLPSLIAEARASLTPATTGERSPEQDAYDQEFAKGIDCGHGYPGGHLIRPKSGTAACPRCRRGHKAASQPDVGPPDPSLHGVDPRPMFEAIAKGMGMFQ